jgi:general secretion pathway protein A
MYASFFGLSEKPFAITPDPRYLFMSERHAEALAHLLYGITEAGGFIQLTGEVGTGKTTIVRSLLERMPKHADVAVILNPQQTPVQFVLTICEELGIFVRDEDVGSIKDLVDILNKRLLDAHAKGRRIVVIVDEAQNLSPETLEQVRLLTNLETASHKLLQIILIGQPELRDVLARVELRQLAQRITGRYHLAPLTREETIAYVNHRMRVAGSNVEVFSNAALREVHRLSDGIPRIINVICDRALLGAFTQETHHVTPALIRSAASEVYGRTFTPPWAKPLAIGSAIVAFLVLGIGIWQLFAIGSSSRQSTATVASAPVATAPTAPAVATAAAAVSPITEQQEADIAELLTAHASETNTESAFSRLFTLWGGALKPASGRPCDQATQQGLQCVYQQGSWGQLRTLNRPAILTLIDDAGNAHQVVVTGLSEGKAQLAFAQDQPQVSVESLSRYWYGDYLVLWRPQVPSQRALSAGMQGDGVRWLRDSLYTVQGKPTEVVDSDLYDEELTRMVEDFQRRHRLNVDGIAGVQTQIVLDTLNNPAGAPLLVAQGG